MKLPLPNGIKPAFTQAGHAGLWFNRFFDRYGTDQESKPPDPWSIGKTDKHDWLKDFPKHTRGEKTTLEQHAWRSIDLIKARGGEVAVFELDWHFVSGMGYPHPVENGLAWHPTLGVPYLTGAAVKGLVRSWMEVWQGVAPEQLRQWFGSETKDPNALADKPPVAGELVFFDALPVAPVTLTVDIMTPHMGKWYEQGGEIASVANTPEAIPADWHDPVPVQYLVVKKAQFLFGVAPRRQGSQQGDAIRAVLDDLEQALGFMGAGAKTAVGYGQMTRKENHPLIHATLSLEDRLTAEIAALTEKQLAERLGKGYNKLVAELVQSLTEPSMYWSILWHLRKDVLLSWKDAVKNTAEAKAYKKLCQTEHIPQLKEES